MRSDHYFHLHDLSGNLEPDVLGYEDPKLHGCYITIGPHLCLNFSSPQAVLEFAATVTRKANQLIDQSTDLPTKE